MNAIFRGALALLFITQLSPSGRAQSGIITTYLGPIHSPTGVVLDGAGNLYFADPDNNRVREVTARGAVTTVAGNGTPGFSGDGDLAISAQLKQPYGVALDSAGNLYIAESQGNPIRKVAAEPRVATRLTLRAGAVATSGTAGTDWGNSSLAPFLQLPQKRAPEIMMFSILSKIFP